MSCIRPLKHLQLALWFLPAFPTHCSLPPFSKSLQWLPLGQLQPPCFLMMLQLHNQPLGRHGDWDWDSSSYCEPQIYGQRYVAETPLKFFGFKILILKMSQRHSDSAILHHVLLYGTDSLFTSKTAYPHIKLAEKDNCPRCSLPPNPLSKR